jgi:hypothetical protein
MSLLANMRAFIAFYTVVGILTGCSAASSLSSLKVEGLKQVEFGESLEQVRAELKPFELLPGPVEDAQVLTYSCDGLTAKYDGCSFVPTFIFRKGKLMVVQGQITNPGPSLTKDLETDLSARLGTPQVHESSKLWSDGGVHVILYSTQAPKQVTTIGFESSER